MAFLYPSFLFALTAIFIPVLLHLIQLRKAKRVVFSNIKFIQVSKDITSSQKTIKEILILICRILFIAFLVFAFAQPFLPASSSNVAANDSDITLVLDNSFSTQNLQSDQDYSVLTGAIERGKSIINLFPKTAGFSILTGNNSSRGKTLTAEDATITLDELEYTASDFPSLSSVNQKPSHLFILSDFQKETFSSTFFNQYDSLSQIHIVPIKGAENSNVTIDSVYLEDEFIRTSVDNLLHVRIKNTGTTVLNDVPVKLFIHDNQVAALSLDLPPKQVTEAVLNFKVTNKNSHKAYIQVDDYPVDFDNIFYFTLKPSTNITVTEIADDKTSPLHRLYRNEPVFKFSSFTTSNPDYSIISGSDIVLLNNIKDLPAALAATLINYVNAGGTLFVSPGTSGNNSYTNLFQGLSISASLTNASDQSTKTSLVAPNPSNPFFKSIFSGYDVNMQMPVSIRNLVWSKSSEDILKFKGGSPYLSRFDRGNGKVYLLAAPLQDDYNSLVNHALFVPIMYKVAIAAYKQEQALAYTLGVNTIKIPVKDLPKREGVFELHQDSLSYIPEQQVRGGNLYFTVPADMNKAGFYTLMLHGKALSTLAFNYNNKESILDQYTPDELKALIGERSNVHVYDYGDAFSVKGEFEKRYFGVKLWKYCLILCLVFLMAEIALIRFL